MVIAGRLAIAYALLVMAPYTEDQISREGSPAQMAAYVIKTARERGNWHKVKQALQ